MKIAIVRGDFLSSWEIPIFEPIARKHDVTLFLGKKPVYKVQIPKNIKVVNLLSPADLNFGKVSRWKMAILNRLFIDAHWLFGLEEELKGFDVVYTAETLYAFSLQSVWVRQKGYVKRVVMHVGENIAFNNEGIWGKHWLKQTCLKGTDKFIAITEKAKDVLLKEGADPKKIARLTPGIDLDHFKKLSVKSYRNIVKNGNLKLLIVSRLIEDKGILEMINIFINLAKKHKDIELVIVGVGPLEQMAHQLLVANNLDQRVFFLGTVPYQDMPTVYSLSDIFMHYPKGSKTWQEQFGFAFVEAMACGVPVITLNSGSSKEVIRDSGHVVSESNYQVTLEKLIIQDKMRNNFSKKASALTKEKYDVKKYSKEVEKILTKDL